MYIKNIKYKYSGLTAEVGGVTLYFNTRNNYRRFLKSYLRNPVSPTASHGGKYGRRVALDNSMNIVVNEESAYDFGRKLDTYRFVHDYPVVHIFDRCNETLHYKESIPERR